jgi:hypothetical protein
MPTRTAQIDPPEIVRATVHVGTLRMDYWRAGRGSPVLLLRASGAVVDPHAPWLSALTRRFSLLAPISLFGTEAEAPLSITMRLRSFLDGLGLERVAAIADVDTAAELLRLALSEPERIERIVIMLPGHSDPLCPEGLPLDQLEQSRQPILIVHMSLPDRSSTSAAPVAECDRMLRFLSGDG